MREVHGESVGNYCLLEESLKKNCFTLVSGSGFTSDVNEQLKVPDSVNNYAWEIKLNLLTKLYKWIITSEKITYSVKQLPLSRAFKHHPKRWRWGEKRKENSFKLLFLGKLGISVTKKTFQTANRSEFGQERCF